MHSATLPAGVPVLPSLDFGLVLEANRYAGGQVHIVANKLGSYLGLHESIELHLTERSAAGLPPDAVLLAHCVKTIAESETALRRIIARGRFAA